MAGAFESAIKGAQEVIRDVTSVRIRYARGALSDDDLRATPATSIHDQQIEGEYRTSFIVDDFLVMKEDIDGKFGEPKRNEFYQVLPMESLPIWTWADSYHNQYRIHCKKVKS